MKSPVSAVGIFPILCYTLNETSIIFTDGQTDRLLFVDISKEPIYGYVYLG